MSGCLFSNSSFYFLCQKLQCLFLLHGQERPHLWLDGFIPKVSISNHLLGADDLSLQAPTSWTSSASCWSGCSLSSLLNLTLSSPSTNLTGCFPLILLLTLISSRSASSKKPIHTCSSSISGFLTPLITYGAMPHLPSFLNTQCPCTSNTGVRYLDSSWVGSNSFVLQIPFLMTTFPPKAGILFMFSPRLLILSTCKTSSPLATTWPSFRLHEELVEPWI